MKLSAKHLFATLGMATVMVVAPTSAAAKGSIHLDLPSLSIGLHDDHRSHKRHRKHQNKHYRSHYNDHYDNRRYERRHHRRDRNRYYNNHRYNDNYSSGRQYNQRHDRRHNSYPNDSYRNDSYRAEVCPIDGYSRYYDRGRNCYQHKGHFHCS
ncbi:MAG: hypothetical protein ACJAQ6_001059 [Arenicella sp.]|jgi:hypothetical protein